MEDVHLPIGCETQLRAFGQSAPFVRELRLERHGMTDNLPWPTQLIRGAYREITSVLKQNGSHKARPR